MDSSRGNVYLAYSPDDAREMELIAAVLRDDRWDVSPGPIVEAGARFTPIIARRLDQAACVVVAWSANSVQSRRISQEAAHAASGRKLVAIQLDHATPPVSEAPAIDMTLWVGPLPPTFVSGLLSLVDATAVRVRPARPTAASRPIGQLGLRIALAISGLFAVALYGWAIWFLSR